MRGNQYGYTLDLFDSSKKLFGGANPFPFHPPPPPPKKKKGILEKLMSEAILLFSPARAKSASTQIHSIEKSTSQTSDLVKVVKCSFWNIDTVAIKCYDQPATIKVVVTTGAWL